MNLNLQGSGDLCGSQTCAAAKLTGILLEFLVFLDDLLMFYQAFGVNSMWYARDA